MNSAWELWLFLIPIPAVLFFFDWLDRREDKE
jgi:hypothetical protein